MQQRDFQHPLPFENRKKKHSNGLEESKKKQNYLQISKISKIEK